MKNKAYFRIKRAIDLAVAVTALVVFSPLILVLILLVLIFMGWPVFFIQSRPGFKEKPFYLCKFRTMRKHASAGEALSDTDRLTQLGRFLRRTSLDELPELFNVLKGDMSLVGPRPLLMEYLTRYSEEQKRRHDMLPGITGWAQVNGRNAVTWKERFGYDLWYIDNWSLWLDFSIMLITLVKVGKGEGVDQDVGVTMKEFMGLKGEK